MKIRRLKEETVIVHLDAKEVEEALARYLESMRLRSPRFDGLGAIDRNSLRITFETCRHEAYEFYELFDGVRVEWGEDQSAEEIEQEELRTTIGVSRETDTDGIGL